MRKSIAPRWPWAVLLVALLNGCGGGGDSESDTSDSTPPPSNTDNSGSLVLSGSTNGRLLASNCYQCHGTNGTGGFDKLYRSDEILSELREYASGGEGNGIMAGHAQGYTDAQMQAIASYLANP